MNLVYLRICLLIWLSAVLSGGLKAQTNDWDQESNQEQALLEVLTSNATPDQKALACKNLAIVGTDRSVPELAKLLPNPELNSWALIALEAIPGEQAELALRDSLKQLNGLCLVGVINSIGVRRDSGAAELLSTQLASDQALVVDAAASALGQIGNLACAEILIRTLRSSNATTRSAAAEGCIVCAERLLSAGETGKAEALYNDVRLAKVPPQRILEATRALVLLQGEAGMPLLLETLRADEKEFLLALQVIRELPDDMNLQALIDELPKMPPAQTALLIHALADRSDKSVLPVLKSYAESGAGEVRVAAIESLGRAGDESCLDVLLAVSQNEDEQVSQLATDALVMLPGAKTNELIAEQLAHSSGAKLASLLRAVGARRISAVESVMTATDSKEPKVRAAALYAAGETIAFEQLEWLLKLADAPTHRAEQAAVWQALKTACVRMPNRDDCAKLINQSLDRMSDGTGVQLLEILASMGGPEALGALNRAGQGKRIALQDAATRLLGTWNGVDAGPVLLKLADSLTNEKFRVRAARGYVGLIRKFDMPNDQRVAMCRSALAVCTRPADRKLLMDVMKLYPSHEMVKFAESIGHEPDFQNFAEEIRQLLDSQKRR